MAERPAIEDIERAAERGRDVILRTPLVPLHSFDGRRDILLKLETLQPVTNFKIRGVFHAVASLPPDEARRFLPWLGLGMLHHHGSRWAIRDFLGEVRDQGDLTGSDRDALIEANVEFYTAVLLDALGLAPNAAPTNN